MKSDLAGALADENQAAAGLPQDPGVFLDRAYIHFASGDSIHATADFEAALALKPATNFIRIIAFA